LLTARAGDDFTDDGGTLLDSPKTGMADTDLMEQDIVAAMARRDEAVTLCKIKPFNLTRNPDRIDLDGGTYGCPF
jgi:hypothetical protein